MVIKIVVIVGFSKFIDDNSTFYVGIHHITVNIHYIQDNIPYII